MWEKIDPWFVQILATLLAGYFLWSVQRILRDFKDEVKGLKETLRLLFAKNDNLQTRLSRLEGRCETVHGPIDHSDGGRRGYDPEERING